jgi:hypothetical protein
MKIRALNLAALVWLLGVGQPAVASIEAVFSLGAPSVSLNTVSFDVNLTFDSGTGSNLELVIFAIDVSQSSDALTAGGTDFSAFSFTLNSAQFPDWSLAQDFGSPFAPGTVQYHTLPPVLAGDPPFRPLPSGTYLLGTLSVDLAMAGVSLDPSLLVSIKGMDQPPQFGEGTFTQIGAQDPNDFTTFSFYPGTFNPDSQPLVPGTTQAVVPEPTTWPWWVAGSSVLFGMIWRRRAA